MAGTPTVNVDALVELCVNTVRLLKWRRRCLNSRSIHD